MEARATPNKSLEKLKTEYKKNLPDKLKNIADKWNEIRETGWSEDLARQFRSLCHSLIGTGETFSYPNVTRLGRIVEQRLNAIFDENGDPDQTRLDELDAAVQSWIVDGPVSVSENKTVQREQTVPDVEKQSDSLVIQPLSTLPIYIVEDDRDLADHIVMELAQQGYDGRAVYDLADLDVQMRQAGVAPGAIVMDVIFPDAVTGGIDIINEFRRDQILKAPVVFVSASDSFSTRLKIVQADGDAFFVKPFDVSVLIEKLESLVGEVNPDPLRILVLDDDEMFATLICTILEDAGLEAKPLNDPTKVIDEILEYRPDLALLDMHMPMANGMEVAKILRQHESCGDLPLLFLSAESDPIKRAAALNVGVDDFLVKPVDPTYLISAVANRAQRARALKAKIYRDSLTQLLVHDEIKNQLANQLSNAKRYSRALSYAILDLDRFKMINDTHGHMTGDHVLKSISSLLRRSFRRSDILGRYGGEEFVIIMQDTSVEQAIEVLDRVRMEFSAVSHQSEVNGEEFHATFSAGISGYPNYEHSDDIQMSADKALYAAKEAGRNRILLAD